MAIVSIGLLLTNIVVLLLIRKIRRTQQNILETLATTNHFIQELAAHAKYHNDVTEEFTIYTSCTLQNIAICMIPFIEDIKIRAVQAEEYEKAQECVNLIKNLKEVIKQTK